MVLPQEVMNGWRPMVVFSKGSVKKLSMRDVFGKQWTKTHHEWQQGVDEAAYYIERLTNRRDLVCDPTGGSFTSAVACKQLGRKFIGGDVDKGAVAAGLERLEDT